MKVRMLSTAAGVDGCLMAGQVVDVDPETAVAWLNGGYAEPVAQPAERATIVPEEKAITNESQTGDRPNKRTRKRD
jgi:hypothetical protein